MSRVTSSQDAGGLAFPVGRAGEDHLRRLASQGAHRLATSFIRGEVQIRGDLIQAVRRIRESAGRKFTSRPLALAARYQVWRLERLFQSHQRAARNIRFHYDRSNEFFRQFLDSRMVYSCAYFKDSRWSIEKAQLAKLDHVCRKLALQPGERFLDVGCGWGALAFEAAARYRVLATGCTLSREQFRRATMERAARGLEGSVSFHEMDYRDLTGEFDKIASVGMFEHVGRRRLRGYFRKMASLLAYDGLFLNHGIVRPQMVEDDAETILLRRHFFPGGELVHLSDVVREAENAGFEILDVENLRPHYALTCRAWVERLQRNSEACLRLVDGETYRTWLLFLAASADSFERGQTDVHQLLLAKRACPGNRRLSRDYMYVH